jgi:type IV pilus assembly protein PilB
MQTKPRIGELLSQLVTLSGHDVEEILHEQQTTQRRFGEIALSWGLCQPEHIWSAWSRQVDETDFATVDLDRNGIDAQAVALLSSDVARTYHAIPIRASEREVVIASDAPLAERARAALGQLLKRDVKFVLATKQQIDVAMEVYYPAQ